jgi:single-strand DNA-binding protein
MNQITISGNLTRDPERFATHNGETVAKFTVAVNEGDSALFLNCVAFKKLADNCLQYIGKGSKVLVSGRLALNEYEKDDKRYKTPEIIAFQVEFLSPKQSEENDMPFPEVAERKRTAPTVKDSVNAIAGIDDDLPF